MNTNNNIQIRIEQIKEYKAKKNYFCILIYKDNKLHEILKSNIMPEIYKYDVLYK